MDAFSSLTPRELAVLTTILAIDLSKGRTTYEKTLIGNLLASVGDVLLLMASHENVHRERGEENKNK